MHFLSYFLWASSNFRCISVPGRKRMGRTEMTSLTGRNHRHIQSNTYWSTNHVQIQSSLRVLWSTSIKKRWKYYFESCCFTTQRHFEGYCWEDLFLAMKRQARKVRASLSKYIPCAFVVVLKIVILIYTLFLPMKDNQRTRNRGRQKRRNPRFCLESTSTTWTCECVDEQELLIASLHVLRCSVQITHTLAIDRIEECTETEQAIFR